ncbi:hypothetical protein SDC9_198470 [bioreactor metagenome]|uniref:Uncharacterized protein n=1 Tax=bioreactor metagenome TaxID=1076179 RepID=A0A645IHQ9_9ZZZZ
MLTVVPNPGNDPSHIVVVPIERRTADIRHDFLPLLKIFLEGAVKQLRLLHIRGEARIFRFFIHREITESDDRVAAAENGIGIGTRQLDGCRSCLPDDECLRIAFPQSRG